MRSWLGLFKRPAAASQGSTWGLVESRATVTLATVIG